MDAVEKSVSILEDDEHVNAGHGSFVNENNEVELDAMIMDGHTLDAGILLFTTNTRNTCMQQPLSFTSKHCFNMKYSELYQHLTQAHLAPVFVFFGKMSQKGIKQHF